MIKKLIATSALLLAAALPVRAATPSAPPPVQVTTDSEVKDLARGYAHAFSLLTHTPVTLAFETHGVIRIINDVRSVQDSDGVLVVMVSNGPTYLVNPKDVIYITDGQALRP